MKRFLILLLVATSLLGEARADERGVSLGARVGYAIPFGSVSGASNDAFDRLYSSGLPLAIDVSWRTGAFSAGVYGQLALASPASPVKADFGDASGNDVRLGVQAAWRFAPLASLARVEPWVGAGFGYEWASVSGKVTNSISGAKTDVTSRLRGFDALAQGGADYRLTSTFSLGPVVALSVGRFAEYSAEGGGTTTTKDITDTAWHGWLVLGIRGTFDL